MVDRIRVLLQERQFTPTQFADAIGVARPIVSHILSGRNKPSLEVVQKVLAAFPDLSMGWLLNGTGPMLIGAAANASAVSAPVAASPAPAPREQPKGRRFAVSQPHTESELRAAIPAPIAVTPAFEVAQPLPSAASQPVIAQPAEDATEVGEPKLAQGVRTQGETPVATGPLPAHAAALPVVPAAVAPPEPALPALLAPPGKTIRRIVIFYQDGSFADYQPE
jgi:transcriptional regulator with XRE-family HTH domain